VVGNIFAGEIVLRYALRPTERFAEAAAYLFLSYMLAIPIVLFFPEGRANLPACRHSLVAAADRASWIRDDDHRLTNFLSRSQFLAAWLFSLLLGAFVISTQPLRALCIKSFSPASRFALNSV
jgi:hypothetical protein